MYIKEDYPSMQEMISFNLRDFGKKQEKYVKDGWIRCRNYGLTSYDCINTFKVTGKELDEILEKNGELIKSAKPFMENLYELVKGTGFVVVLADVNFCVLEVIGDQESLSFLETKTDIQKGTIWDERHVGNTAISTSVIEEKPIQMSGSEHYLIELREWTCSSAPIKKKGKVIGVLNVMGYKDNTHAHTLGMVTAVTRAIESYMKINEAHKELIIKNKYQNAIVECMADGFLTIDNKGMLTFINALGAEILGIDGEESIGKNIKDLVDFDPIILKVLETGKGYQDKEFIVRDQYGVKYHFIKSAIPIRDAEGNIIGVVDSFRKIKRVHNMVRKMVGAYAKFNFEDIIGKSNKMQECIRLAKVAAKSSSNVLVYGESGTGKEMIVQSIHNASRRKNESFISINCAAIPSELIESELFGYEGGAFTGALRSGQTGKFELANGGTIFLDEIGDMPLHLQGKLLRVLQENQITRVGGTDVIDIDVRIVSATNKNLLLECKKGNFREDLYYRLNVLNINLAPLRERKEDIGALAYHFIRKINEKMDKNIKEISNEALNCLINYNWPGNIRELENSIERAMNICMECTIQIEHLSEELIEEDTANNFDIFSNRKMEILNRVEGSKNISRIRTLQEIERQAIIDALKIMEGNITKAAEALNVSRNTLYNKIEKYKL